MGWQDGEDDEDDDEEEDLLNLDGPLPETGDEDDDDEEEDTQGSSSLASDAVFEEGQGTGLEGPVGDSPEPGPAAASLQDVNPEPSDSAVDAGPVEEVIELSDTETMPPPLPSLDKVAILKKQLELLKPPI